MNIQDKQLTSFFMRAFLIVVLYSCVLCECALMYTDKLVRILFGALALPQDTSNILDISVPNKQ